MLTSVSDAAKKPTKSKEELNFERKQELEKRLQDVNDQLNPKESFKSNVALFSFAMEIAWALVLLGVC